MKCYENFFNQISRDLPRTCSTRVFFFPFSLFFFFFLFFQQMYARETSVNGEQYGKYLARFHACRHDLQICLLCHFRGRRDKFETREAIIRECWCLPVTVSRTMIGFHFICRLLILSRQLITDEFDNTFSFTRIFEFINNKIKGR